MTSRSIITLNKQLKSRTRALLKYSFSSTTTEKKCANGSSSRLSYICIYAKLIQNMFDSAHWLNEKNMLLNVVCVPFRHLRCKKKPTPVHPLWFNLCAMLLDLRTSCSHTHTHTLLVSTSAEIVSVYNNLSVHLVAFRAPFSVRRDGRTLCTVHLILSEMHLHIYRMEKVNFSTKK